MFGFIPHSATPSPCCLSLSDPLSVCLEVAILEQSGSGCLLPGRVRYNSVILSSLLHKNSSSSTIDNFPSKHFSIICLKYLYRHDCGNLWISTYSVMTWTFSHTTKKYVIFTNIFAILASQLCCQNLLFSNTAW